MALRIIRREKEKEAQNKQEMIWRIINAEPELMGYFNPKHPVFEWRFLNMGQCLSYRVGFKENRLPHSVVGAAQVFNLCGPYPDILTKREFNATFMAVINTLLFDEAASDTLEEREAMVLHDENYVIQWDAVKKYMTLAVRNLPFDFEVIETAEGLTAHFSHSDDSFDCTGSKYPLHKDTEQNNSLGMLDNLETIMSAPTERIGKILEQHKRYRIDDSLKERIKIVLTRAIFQMRTAKEYERGKFLAERNPETQGYLEQARRYSLNFKK